MSSTVEDLRCEDVLDRIEAYIDDDLGPGERRSFEHHLKRCSNCSGEVDLANQTVAALRALPELDAPSRVMEKAWAAIDSRDPARIASRVNRRRRLWFAAAAAAIVGFLGTAVFQFHSRNTETEALRAAAEVRLAIATISEISQRANRVVQTKVIDNGPIPQSLRGFVQSLEPLTSLQTTDESIAAPSETKLEGSS